MALTVDTILEDIFEVYPDVDEMYADIATATSDMQEPGDLARDEDKTIKAKSPSAIQALILSDKEDTTRICRCVPALQLKRCASFKELDWLDSFLWLTSEVYREQKPTPVQKKLVGIFLEELKTNDTYYEPLLDTLTGFPGGTEQFGIVDSDTFANFFEKADSLKKAQVLAFGFGYDLHIFSFKSKSFFSPKLISQRFEQSDKPAIFMLQTVDGHIEPVFELDDAFASVFSWNDPLLCRVKDVCNETIKPPYARPSNEECSALPTGTTLDSIDDWLRAAFFTWVDIEQPVIDDSRSYPLPKLATKVRHQKNNGSILEIDLPTQVKIQKKILENKWTVAKTVGDGTCLVHSILQSTSEAYRSIPHNERALVGQWYRYSVLPRFYDETSEFEEPLLERLKDSTEFLEDIDLSKIVNGLDINVVVVNTLQRIIKIVTPVTTDAESIEIFKGKPYIFLLNSGALHFSSIYLGAQQKFLLTEAEMLELYPEIVDEMYKDKDYKDVRKELVRFVRSSGADNSIKEPIVQNIYRHERPREGEGAPVAPDMHARNLEGKLDAYAGTLGISPRNFNRFRQTLRNTTSGVGRRRKTRKV